MSEEQHNTAEDEDSSTSAAVTHNQNKILDTVFVLNFACHFRGL